MTGRFVFNLMLLAVSAYFVWAAFGLEPAGRRIPILIGVLVLVFQGWVTVREFLSPPTAPPVLEGGEEIPPDEGRRVAIMTAWMVGYFALFTVFGTLIATVAFIFLFLVSVRAIAWWGALGIAAAMSLAIWVTFVKLMRFELYEGLLFGGTLPAL
jgi:hypothetical protein